MISICLGSNLGLSQTAVSTPEVVDAAETNAALLQLLQEQHQTVLQAIDHIQRNADVALNGYRLALAEQVNLLKEDFVSYREQDLEVMRGLNQHSEIVSLVAAGLAIFILLLNAVIFFWGMSGIATRLTAILNAASSGTFHATVMAGGPAAPVLDDAAMQASARLLEVIERLDKRLLELESKKNSLAAAEARRKGAPAPSDFFTASAKSGEVPRVSLTLGEGSAIGFLPQEAGAMKLHAWWSRVQKWKRTLKRSRS